MRQIGMIAEEADARRLADHLQTLDITTRIDPSPEGWVVWVHHEDRVEQARQELDSFLNNPDDPRYVSASAEAQKRRKEAERRDREHQKNTRDVREIWSGPDFRRCPLTHLLIAFSIAVFLYTGWGKITRRVEPFAISRLQLVQIDVPAASPSREAAPAIEIRSEGLEPIRQGQVWRLVTPIFLHFGMIHILFNMYILYILGNMIELRRGTLRLAGLVLVAAVLSNLAQFAWSDFKSPMFGGMSGVNYALLGYIWMKREYAPELGLSLSQGTIMVMLIWMLMGFLDVIPNIANLAHFGGLVVGMLVGIGPHLLGGHRDE